MSLPLPDRQDEVRQLLAALGHDEPATPEPRTVRVDISSFFQTEARIFKVSKELFPGITHAQLVGHPLAFEAFRREVIEEVLAAACRCNFRSFDGGLIPDADVRRMILEEVKP